LVLVLESAALGPVLEVAVLEAELVPV